MSAEVIGAIAFFLVFGFIILEVPVGVSMGLVGFAGIVYFLDLPSALSIIGTTPWEAVSSYTLAVMPLFVLMGCISTESGISADIYKGMQALFGHKRGGLSYATIGASAGFGMICGSSLATTATMGKLALPEMDKYGYKRFLSCGSIAAGGTLGIMIPPSVILVIYAFMAEQSIKELFMGAVFPALLAVSLYFLAVKVILFFSPDAAPVGKKAPWAQRKHDLKGLISVSLVFIIVMGGLYGGIFTANEAAAIGVLVVLFAGLLKRTLNLSGLKRAIWNTVRIAGALYFIVIGASLFNIFLALSGVPFALVELFNMLDLSPIGVLLLMLVIYVVLGSMMDSLAMLLLTIPMFLPVVVANGIDPVWFGIFAVVVVELGLITPPIGLNLFVIKATHADVRLPEMWKGVIPFVLSDVIRILVLLVFPQLVLWLPKVVL
jgi:tripartite ATP-independent transporter DctM subunit